MYVSVIFVLFLPGNMRSEIIPAYISTEFGNRSSRVKRYNDFFYPPEPMAKEPAVAKVGVRPTTRNSKALALEGITINYFTKHWYSLELNVKATACYLIQDMALSTPAVPIFDLAYLADSPYGQIRRIANIAQKMADPQTMQMETRIALGKIYEPNSVGILPAGTIEENQPPNMWWFTSGAMTGDGNNKPIGQGPALGGGKIGLLDMTQPNSQPHPISTMSGWGFTQTEWIDMDADGLVDCVTIRVSTTAAQLIWLRQPTEQHNWEANIIIEDCGGTNFKVVRISEKAKGKKQTERLVILIAGYKRQELIAVWVDDDANDWSRTQKLQNKIIDNAGAYLSIDVIDLNGDGRMDILTSISGIRGRGGAVVGYEIPTDFTNEKSKWVKRILSNRFSQHTSFHRVTPGTSIPFIPRVGERKPSILVSGRDDGRVYVLKPASWSPYIWKYETEVIFTRPSKIGEPAIGDTDGDGIVEIFIPEGNYLHVMTYEHTLVKKSSADSLSSGSSDLHASVIAGFIFTTILAFIL